MPFLTRCSLALALSMPCGCHTIFDGELGTVHCQAEGAYGPPACPPTQTCVEGTCTAVGAPLGAGCGSDADCRAPGWCLDPAAIGRPGSPRCSRPCCASSDCGPPETGQVCFSPDGMAGAICWPHDDLGRVAPGMASGGAACTAGSDCRSGACDKRCHDLCCGDASCDGGRICRLKVLPEDEGDSWSCGLPPSEANARFCLDDQDCRRGRCVVVEGIADKLCAEPCCGSDECGSVEIDGTTWALACTPSVSGAAACARALPKMADGAVGTPCEGDEGCRSGFCLTDGEERYCSDLCCSDDSCGDLSRFACRLGEVAGFSALRCIRK